MKDLVDTIRDQIAARLEELRPLAREASDLQRALDALHGVPAAAKADLALGAGSPVLLLRRGVACGVRKPGRAHAAALYS